MNVLRTLVPVVDPQDVPYRSLGIKQVRGWLLHRNSRLGPQESAAVLSATRGESARKARERYHGNAHNVKGSDDDGDDMRKPQDQLGVTHDGAYGSDDVHYRAEQWDRYKELLGLFDDDVLDNDDEEVHSLVQGEPDALAAPSQSTRTLAQARRVVKDAWAVRKPLSQRSAAASARNSEMCLMSWSTPCSRLSRSAHTTEKARRVVRKASRALALAKAALWFPWLRHLQQLPDPRFNSSRTATAVVVIWKVQVENTIRSMCMPSLTSDVLKVHLGLNCKPR